MELPLYVKILAALVFLGANAFFVAAEFALVKVRRTRIREMASGGDRMAKVADRILSDLDRSISGTQLGITIASLGLGWIGEPAVAEPLRDLFGGFPEPFSVIATHSVATAIAFVLITILHIVLGELAPKTLALIQPETVSRLVAVPLDLFNRIAAPAVWFLNGAANLVVRGLGGRELAPEGRVHSPEEIELLLRQSRAEGIVEQDEEAMIHGVFELTRTVAREVMTPRTDIVAVPGDAELDEVLAIAANSGFSRLPVYVESIDDIVGVLLVKDLLRWFRNGDPERFRPVELVREAFFVPDTKPVDDLLAELRRNKVHLAVVVDEFGGTDGIVTLEDLVEEVVGEIYDEHDIAEAEIRVLPDDRILVDGGASFSDLVERFGVAQPEEEYDTVAGFVMGRLGRIPDPGDIVALGLSELEVLETRDRRVTRLQLHLPEEEEGAVPDGGRPAGDAPPPPEA